MAARAEVYAVRHDLGYFSKLKEMDLPPEEIRLIVLACLEKQIPSYLGEFILKSPFKEFFYEEETNSQTGRKELHAPGFIWPIADIYDNAIWENKRHGRSVRRETAECEGFRKLEKDILEAPEGTFYLWISPPGTKEEGYGDYSFTHLGQIKIRNGVRRIEVTAVRNKLSLEEHAQVLNRFLPEEGRLKSPRDTDFLRCPVLIKNGGNHTVDDLLVAMDVILKQKCGQNSQFAKDYRQRKDWEKELLERVRPMINDYYSLVEKGVIGDELQRVIWAIENYTRDQQKITPPSVACERPVLADEFERVIFYQRMGYEPEKLEAGGCPPDPSSGSKDPFSPSAVLPSQQHLLENKTSQCTECSNPEPHFHCPKERGGCGGAIESGKGTTICPHCGLTKERAGSKCD
ncbi:MAG: hypothetical protein Q8P89_04955 [bacterium]|nr:hypothetical protein [bacterium]